MFFFATENNYDTGKLLSYYRLGRPIKSCCWCLLPILLQHTQYKVFLFVLQSHLPSTKIHPLHSSYKSEQTCSAFKSYQSLLVIDTAYHVIKLMRLLGKWRSSHECHLTTNISTKGAGVLVLSVLGIGETRSTVVVGTIVAHSGVAAFAMLRAIVSRDMVLGVLWWCLLCWGVEIVQV